MAKSRAEINRANYLKNKAKIKAKYKDKKGDMYWTFNNVVMDEDLYNKLVQYMGENNLNDTLKNDLLLAATYIYQRCRQNKFGFVRIYVKSIRKHSNMLAEAQIRKLIQHISDVKMSVVRKDNGKVFFLVNEKNDIKKIFDKKIGQMAETNIIVRDFHFTGYDYLNRNEKKIDGLKMSYKTLKSWGLNTYPELLQVAYSVVDETYQTVKKQKKTKINGYQNVEYKFEGFHSKLTDEENLVFERFDQLRVEEQTMVERIKQLTFDKENIDFEKVDEASQVLNTLQQRNKSFSHGRLYYPMFTRLNKDWRDVLTLNGQHIKELFDVPTCHSTKSLILYSHSQFRNDQELRKLFDVIMFKDIYCWIGTEIGWKDIDEQKREVLKEHFNRWLFLSSSGRRKVGGLTKEIDQQMKRHFSSFYQFITSQEEIEVVNENGKKVIKNTLSVQCEWLENKLLINGLFKKVKHLNTITLHDAIFITVNQWCKSLSDQLKAEWREIVKQEIFN